MIPVFAHMGISLENEPDLKLISANVEIVSPYQQTEKSDVKTTYLMSDDDIKYQFVIGKDESEKSMLNEMHEYFRDQQLTILNKIQEMGVSWSAENIPGPNNKVISLTEQVINQLAQDNIFANRMTQTADEGICIIFNKGDQRLYFEFYNDGEIGYIIESISERKILENEDIFSIENVIEKISNFLTTNYEIS